MPGNRLSLPVGVGRKEYPVGLPGSLLEFSDDFFLPGDDNILRRKVFLDVDA